MPDGDYASVVAKIRPGAIDPGEIVDLDGNVLGGHEGIINFTVGQRRGIGVGGAGEPLYVIRIEPDSRRVVVGPGSALGERIVRLSDVNWLGDTGDIENLTVKVRSTQPPVPARLSLNEDLTQAEVVLETPERAVAPGQACVFYQGDRLLGGGWIQRAA